MSDPAPTSSSTDSHRPSRFLLTLSLLAMLILWSLNYVAGKVALRQLEPFTLGSFRVELAALLIVPFYLTRRPRNPVRVRDIWLLSYLGLFLCMNQFCFTVGLNYTSSGHSSVILAFGPIMVLLLAVAMKLEALTPAKIIGMSLSLIGVLVLETEQGLFTHSPFLTGDLITLVGTTIFSFYAVFGKKAAREFDTLTMNTFNYLAGAILLLPIAVRQGIRLDWGSVGWAAWSGLFYMAAISSVVAYMLFYWALRHMTVSRVTAINYFQPLGAILVSAVFLAEHPTRNLLAGGALVILGVYLAERGTA